MGWGGNKKTILRKKGSSLLGKRRKKNSIPGRKKEKIEDIS